jgi:hypothetical protein
MMIVMEPTATHVRAVAAVAGKARCEETVASGR